MSEERKITYVVGDLFKLLPYESGNPKVVPHCCNNKGGWGSGFVVPLAKKWPVTRESYRRWCETPNMYDVVTNKPFALGETQIVPVQEGSGCLGRDPEPPEAPTTVGPIYVANMIAQHNTISPENPKPIRYLALMKCMVEVAKTTYHLWAQNGYDPQIHCPMFGSALAGGNWLLIEEMIQELWVSAPKPSCHVNVFVYVLEKNLDDDPHLRAFVDSRL